MFQAWQAKISHNTQKEETVLYSQTANNNNNDAMTKDFVFVRALSGLNTPQAMHTVMFFCGRKLRDDSPSSEGVVFSNLVDCISVLQVILTVPPCLSFLLNILWVC